MFWSNSTSAQSSGHTVDSNTEPQKREPEEVFQYTAYRTQWQKKIQLPGKKRAAKNSPEFSLLPKELLKHHQGIVWDGKLREEFLNVPVPRGEAILEDLASDWSSGFKETALLFSALGFSSLYSNKRRPSKFKIVWPWRLVKNEESLRLWNMHMYMVRETKQKGSCVASRDTYELTGTVECFIPWILIRSKHFSPPSVPSPS